MYKKVKMKVNVEVDNLLNKIVKDLEDVVMLEMFNGACLTSEALTIPFRSRQVGVEYLDGYLSTQSHVPASVDRGHATLTDFLYDLVFFDDVSDQCGPQSIADTVSLHLAAL